MNERQSETEDTRDTAYIKWGNNVPALKHLRQYPLVLSIKVSWAEGKALGNKVGKSVGSAEFLPCSSQEVPHGIYHVWA